MPSSDYKQRRLALEKQYQEDLELLRAAHEAKLRALETLGLASTSAGGNPAQAEPAGKPAPREASGGEKPQGELRPVPRGGLKQAIRDVLPQLPEVFERRELEKALGFTPNRTTLVRILQELWYAKEITILEFSEGRRPTKYGKVAAEH